MRVLARSLSQCEEVIERGLSTFVEVGVALMEIRDSRLYRETHDTFEAYCRQRWQFSDRRASQIIEASQVPKILGTSITVESHARKLAPLKDQPEEMAAAWAEAIQDSDGQPTARAVERAVKKRTLTEAEQLEEDRLGQIRRARARLESLVIGWIELVALPSNPNRDVLLKGLIESDRQTVKEIEAMYLEYQK